MFKGDWNTALGERGDRVQAGIPVGRYSYFPWSDEQVRLFVRSIGRFTSINETAYIHRNHAASMASSSMGLFDILQGADRKRYEKAYVKDAHGRNFGHKTAIGNDVWIGAYVFINASTVKSIGDGAILASGAVITKDVPPYAIVGGVNKILRYRFSPELIDTLLRIKWWDWNDDKIREHYELLMKPELLVARFGSEGSLDSST